jgi:hypothetical protein
MRTLYIFGYGTCILFQISVINNFEGTSAMCAHIVYLSRLILEIERNMDRSNDNL